MRYKAAFLLAAAGIGLAVAAGAPGEEKQPVYVGARVCASCHEGKGMGNQFSHWLLSKHSMAYATLALPEAKAIARLSGIPVEPRESPICLGCHATAFEAEEWERDPTFLLEDGVQCEKCHGPGSEYVDVEVMRDHDAALAAGLRYPGPEACEKCHYVKGSHAAIHKLPQLDIAMARETIAHASPEGATMGSLPSAELVAPTNESGGPRYVGVHACVECHAGPEMGYQYSLWRLGPHARSYAVLATPAADAIARKTGVEDDPQSSPDCLPCHTIGPETEGAGHLETFSPADGVGCESCHGAGSEYLAEAIMRDPRAARASGLKRVDRATCARCHEKAHGNRFEYESAVARIAHPTKRIDVSEGPRYKTPMNLAISPDGGELFVACESSNSVIVVDARGWSKLAEIPVGGQPNDVAFSPDGRTVYVTNRLDDSVSVIDVGTREVVRTFPVGDEPHGVLPDASGKILYVLNTAAGSISVVDATTYREVKRLSASRNPWSLSMSPDGRRLLVTNNLSRFVEFRETPTSEVTVVDTENAVVEDRMELRGANLIQGVDWHPEGDFAVVTLNRTKNLVPMTRILQGWTITNGIGVLWPDGRVDQILLDEPNLYFPDATDVAVTPDGHYALVTSAGSDRVAVADLDKLRSMLDAATAEERARVIPNHLGKSSEFVVAQVPTGNAPRGLVVDHDGRYAFVANGLDDSLTVVDLETLEGAARIDLGGPKEIDAARRGDRLFHSANIAFQRQFSCSSCHPDGHVDSITYDIEPDGIGLDPVDNRTLRGILDTDPFKWTGKNPTLMRQCGPRLAVFFTRIEPFAPDELRALDEYISTIPRPPNRYRPLGAPLTEAQRRGKAMFERTVANDGRIIAEKDRCVTCHFPPLYTDRSRRDVGTKMWLDRDGVFDVPHLNNIYDSPPYLHNGIAPTLEQIWTTYNPEDKHGVTNDMTKDQLNDLIEYLKTL
jgi:YVTN family beta-propeller protein